MKAWSCHKKELERRIRSQYVFFCWHKFPWLCLVSTKQCLHSVRWQTFEISEWYKGGTQSFHQIAELLAVLKLWVFVFILFYQCWPLRWHFQVFGNAIGPFLFWPSPSLRHQGIWALNQWSIHTLQNIDTYYSYSKCSTCDSDIEASLAWVQKHVLCLFSNFAVLYSLTPKEI